ncbi:hypothetical protein RchiOBHm_Chr1g0322801 [Rosa chinensis]|uniref:Uncharacterized protein n=1 Tax=Rosa chinensis TaxID=74649 RepID=A0A2P6S9B4_ROSCH|nr:hypothetical protein RchiOBHm_Chr1g0322801 [Rosa chinensis]
MARDPRGRSRREGSSRRGGGETVSRGGGEGVPRSGGGGASHGSGRGASRGSGGGESRGSCGGASCGSGNVVAHGGGEGVSHRLVGSASEGGGVVLHGGGEGSSHSEGSSHGASSRVEYPRRDMGPKVPKEEDVEVLEIPHSPHGRLLLGDTSIDQLGPSMTEMQIADMRAAWGIPDHVWLRPLRGDEHFSHPEIGWACFYEYQLKCGLSFPIPEELQYLLSCLNIAVGQLSPNALRQLMGLLLLWMLCRQQCPSINEFNSLFKMQYSTKVGDGGCVNFQARGRMVIEDLPSNIYGRWRGRPCLVGGRWQNPDMMHQVPTRFQPINEYRDCVFSAFCNWCVLTPSLCILVRQETALTTLKQKHVVRVMGALKGLLSFV